MLTHGKYILQIAFCCAALVALEACNPQNQAWVPLQPKDSGQSSEALLTAERGEWQLLDEETFHSPVNDHMSARSHVDTSRRSISKELRAHAKLKKARERTLILVPQDKAVQDLDSFMELKMALLLPTIPTKPSREIEAQSDVQIASADVKKNETFSASVGEQLQNIEPAASDDQSEAGAAVIASVRFGDHPGKTRMVVDVTNPAAFHHSLDNETGILVVQVDGAAWKAGLSSKLMQHPLILGYRAQNIKEGTVIALKLKKPAKIKWSADLPPEKGSQHRLVFDIATL